MGGSGSNIGGWRRGGVIVLLRLENHEKEGLMGSLGESVDLGIG